MPLPGIKIDSSTMTLKPNGRATNGTLRLEKRKLVCPVHNENWLIVLNGVFYTEALTSLKRRVNRVQPKIGVNWKLHHENAPS